jgi:hypothetical protein
MAYTNNTQMAAWIAPCNIGQVAAGSPLNQAYASQVSYLERSAAAGTMILQIPIVLPANAAYRVGAYLQSVDLVYKINTADATDFATVDLNKITVVPATGSNTTFSGASQTVSLDSTHNTAALRKIQGTHTMTVTPATPPWIDHDEQYVLACTIACAATTVLQVFGARANFTLRV